MKAWTYIITATVCVALSVTFLTSPAVSTAQDGGRTITPVQVRPVEPGIAPTSSPAASRILYFAPTTGRNLDMDEGVVQMARNGAEVTYVTDADQFADFLFNLTWDSVLVVDIPEEALASDVLAESALGDVLVIRITTGGRDATLATGVRQFGDATSPLNSPARGILHTIAKLIEFAECRGWCILHTPALSQARRDCDQACNEALGQP